MRTVDAEVQIILKDSRTGERMSAHMTFKDLYSRGSVIRLPRMSVDFKPMEMPLCKNNQGM